MAGNRNSGGARPGAGRKKKPLADKLLEGKADKAKIIHLDLTACDMPPPRDLLAAKQKDGSDFEAAAIYKETWEWLKERGCVQLISPDLLNRYAVVFARWLQCQKAINDYGFLTKHPTTGEPMLSPFIKASETFMNETNRLWSDIFQIVKENCTEQLTEQDNLMEKLLSRGRG